MSDRFGIDSHKLAYHPGRVAQWASAKDWESAKSVYPVYVEVSPVGACNHRCTFCAVDYIGYQQVFLETAVLKDRLVEMGGLGVRSIMYAGEGEPLLHKDMAEIAVHTKEKAGIDVSFTTNAVALTDKFIDKALHACSWIKASVNAGTAKTYADVHRTKPEDFERVWRNLGAAAKARSARKLKTALGAQMVLLPENELEAVTLAKRARDAGLDYAVIKPYSQHHKSVTRQYESVRYEKFMKLEEELAALETKDFHVVFRSRTMRKWDDPERGYSKCHATPFFWAYVMANGDVYGCSAYLLDDRFNYGSIATRTFKQVWEGPKREANYHYVLKELDISECRKNCRMDEVNRYLWSVSDEPPAHVNFI